MSAPVIYVVSPAKSLDFETPAPAGVDKTPCRFEHEAARLVDYMRTYSIEDLQALMSISRKLAETNVTRFSDWRSPMPDEATKSALFAFKGDVYTGLSAETLSLREVERAQRQLRILSGLYGLLRPLDGILPYRLEMGTRLSTERGKNLYQWWGEQLTEQLREDIQSTGAKALVNLASNEYFKAIDPKRLPVPVITPVFRDWKNGQYKMISFYAKKARGLMVRYGLQNAVQFVDDLKSFNLEGYRFDPDGSNDQRWQFLRDTPSQ